MLKNLVLAGSVALMMGACTTQQQSTAAGGAVGAGIGAAAGGLATGRAGGALAGAVVGGTAGAVLGAVANRPGYCYARNQYGERVVVRCPPGY